MLNDSLARLQRRRDELDAGVAAGEIEFNSVSYNLYDYIGLNVGTYAIHIPSTIPIGFVVNNPDYFQISQVSGNKYSLDSNGLQFRIENMDVDYYTGEIIITIPESIIDADGNEQLINTSSGNRTRRPGRRICV